MNMREHKYKVLQMTLGCGLNLKKWQLAEAMIIVMIIYYRGLKGG